MIKSEKELHFRQLAISEEETKCKLKSFLIKLNP